MNLQEYEKVKDLGYLEYCDYLQEKYGKGRSNYMTKSWNKNGTVSRTRDGLVAHHKFEHCAIKLSEKEYAMRHPYEWQLADNIVYCDYLEHLLLHILICEMPNKNTEETVGVGGIISYIVPELNDFYSGWQTQQKWRANCHELIKNDKDVYLTLVKRFKDFAKPQSWYHSHLLLTSFNETFNIWSKSKNTVIFYEIRRL